MSGDAYSTATNETYEYIDTTSSSGTSSLEELLLSPEDYRILDTFTSRALALHARFISAMS